MIQTERDDKNILFQISQYLLNFRTTNKADVVLSEMTAISLMALRLIVQKMQIVFFCVRTIRCLILTFQYLRPWKLEEIFKRYIKRHHKYSNFFSFFMKQSLFASSEQMLFSSHPSNSKRKRDRITKSVICTGSLNKFPDFFRIGTFIDSVHMKL